MGKASRRKRSRHDTDFIHTGRKLSECLLELIDPYRDDSLNRDDYSNLLTIAATAWNLSTFPIEEREPALQRVLQAAPLSHRQDTNLLIHRLLARKDQLFPNDDRFIEKTEVIEDEDEFRVVVASLARAE